MRWLSHLSVIIALVVLAQCSPTTSGTTEKIEILTAEYVMNDDYETQQSSTEKDLILNEKTISELVHDQTEVIKKIIAEHNATTTGTTTTQQRDYPVVTKQKQQQQEQKNKKHEKELESLEELKIKCQQLSKLLRNEGLKVPLTSTTIKPSTAKPTVQSFGPYIKPEFLKFKPQRLPNDKPYNNNQQQMTGNYFIYTQNPQMYGYRTNKFSDKLESAASELDDVRIIPEDAVEIPPPVPQTPPSRLKYVKLEPLVLQKTQTPNGKPLYYWYRVLQTNQNFIQIPDTPENKDVEIIAQPQRHHQKDAVPLPENYRYYMDPITGAINPNILPTTPTPTTTTTTTTTTETPVTMSKTHPRPQYFINPETGMIYKSAQPLRLFHETHRRPSSSSSSTAADKVDDNTPIVPTYTVEITEKKNNGPPMADGEKLKHEFKFVIPLLVTGTAEHVSNYHAAHHYHFDPYAYYPKELRSKIVNLPLPFRSSNSIQQVKSFEVPNVHLEKLKNA